MTARREPRWLAVLRTVRPFEAIAMTGAALAFVAFATGFTLIFGG
jgi:hypothetical protein